MSCLITSDIDAPSCDSGKKGGLQTAIWVFNYEELDQGQPVAQVATGTEAGKVTGINLQTYKNARKWNGVRNRNGAFSYNSYNEELQEQGYYNQSVAGRFRPENQEVLNTLDSSVDVPVLIVVETSNKEFKAYGIDGGLTLQTFVQTSGQAFADDNSANLTFAGISDKPAPFVDNGDYESTLNMLNGYLE